MLRYLPLFQLIGDGSHFRNVVLFRHPLLGRAHLPQDGSEDIKQDDGLNSRNYELSYTFMFVFLIPLDRYIH